ncbi:hypothetical protein DSO57_1034851 [Entomophthora muscae]|uniref:Uncharacterized protein n=1 Tax=Entomophthora muscae TaxID=34485 RepID=A0ACC2TXK9_9FUNG|nr:hypothetical protein DSO57_1034851 [Entomophthora muscae]
MLGSLEARAMRHNSLAGAFEQCSLHQKGGCELAVERCIDQVRFSPWTPDTYSRAVEQRLRDSREYLCVKFVN